jgi:hypothetical protein
MNRLVFTTLLVCTTVMISCQSDSDYLIGSYDVTTTVLSSDCPENMPLPLDNMILPSGFLSGQSLATRWNIHRVGITGTGTDKIHLILMSTGSGDTELMLSGSLEDGTVCIENQQNISREVYRFILLYGFIDGEHITGEIRTLLSHPSDSFSAISSMPPSILCEIHEAFSGIQR